MDMSELPEPWSTAAERAGVRQTYRGIGDAAGLSHVTVKRLIAEGRTSQTTITKVAEALRVDQAKVYQWASVEVSEWGPWVPPAEAHKLNPRARAALEELIRAMVQEDGGKSDAGTAEAEKMGVSTRDDMTLAARRGASTGRAQWERAQTLGEESQDDGGLDPA